MGWLKKVNVTLAVATAVLILGTIALTGGPTLRLGVRKEFPPRPYIYRRLSSDRFIPRFPRSRTLPPLSEYRIASRAVLNPQRFVRLLLVDAGVNCHAGDHHQQQG